MTSENFGEQPDDNFRFAQELAANLYEKGMTPSDVAYLTESERILIRRVTETPSERALVRFLGHKEIDWGRATKLDEVQMPKIVRLRLDKLFKLRNELAYSKEI
jgi:hypothetical protein